MIQASFRIVAPAEKRREVRDVLACLRGPTEVSKGCRACQVLQDVDDENLLACVERWDAQADVKGYVRGERLRPLFPYIEMSVGPPGVEFHDIQKVQGMELLLPELSACPKTSSPRPACGERGWG